MRFCVLVSEFAMLSYVRSCWPSCWCVFVFFECHLVILYVVIVRLVPGRLFIRSQGLVFFLCLGPASSAFRGFVCVCACVSAC